MLLPVHKNTKLLIFDCDGTISNNMHIHMNSWISVLNEKGFELSLEKLISYHGLPSPVILKNLYNNLADEDIAVITKEIREKSYNNLDKSEPIQPVIDLIDNYHGKIPMLVISGGQKKNVHKSLESLGLINHFDEIITADDDHPSKNTVEAFTMLADKYNVKYEECHVFEDGVPGLINALKAGMTVTDIRNIVRL